MICIYFHADDEPPEFELPQFISDEIAMGGWTHHLNWNIGFLTLNPVDWVDQAGDHAHFHMLHSDFRIPWTNIELPAWLKRLVPLAISHELTTYRGDDQPWVERHEKTGWGNTDKHLIYFLDRAGLTWKGKNMESTVSETVEMYLGPAIMLFNIPFTIGAMKVFVSTTPVEGGSIMRMRTFIDASTRHNPFVRFIAWILAGVSASQLDADISIMTNKIRPKKPILQPFDGPFNKTNTWLKLFYSESSEKINECSAKAYENDW